VSTQERKEEKLVLKIRDVFKKVEKSEKMSLFFDCDEQVDSDEVAEFVAELSEQVRPLQILKVDIDTLFSWKELEETALRTSAVLTIIDSMLPQFGLTDYIPYA
jgi:hypothetical protein